MEPPSPRLTALLSCYPILSTLSSYISSLDLLQLTLVNRSCFSCILDAPLTFDTLRRRCLCDGHGIIGRRRDHDKTYYPSARRFRQNRVQSNGCVDEQIEIRLYVLKCDTADTLPCRKCDINVCEECRWHVGDRAGPIARLPDSRRPHLNGASQSENVMCLCPSCDEKVEDEVKGRFLHELCDCDTERRWICRKCEREESGFTSRYYVRHTVIEKDEEDTKVLADHGFRRSFYCTCGALVPDKTRPRCTWCKRRHLPEDEWHEEYEQMDNRLPPLSIDPDHPYWLMDEDGKYPTPYPRLGYI